MRDKEQDAAQMAVKRKEFIEKGFELFVNRSIEAVSMQEIADASGYGVATLYRYFRTKQDFVVEVAVKSWEKFREENRKRRPAKDFSGMTAADIFEFYLDSFLEMHRGYKDLLKFNQFFNVYVQSDHVDRKTLGPYREQIIKLKERFHLMYLKAEQDKTIRTDEPEEKMFSTTLHLMLAAVTRYAVGLIYIPEKDFEPEEEIEVLKDMLMEKYTTAG
ncbi:MAG: TetR/AcrR family transcriptional regulator [Lachnospiraceae bacterium]|nr:TetR/AcrR family transcriptional regulator [Lachnospiraceae bacterium]